MFLNDTSTRIKISGLISSPEAVEELGSAIEYFDFSTSDTLLGKHYILQALDAGVPLMLQAEDVHAPRLLCLEEILRAHGLTYVITESSIGRETLRVRFAGEARDREFRVDDAGNVLVTAEFALSLAHDGKAGFKQTLSELERVQTAALTATPNVRDEIVSELSRYEGLLISSVAEQSAPESDLISAQAPAF